MIVTAWIEEADLAPFTRLRDRFFPPDRNHLDAHLTLFHHIDGEDRAAFIAFARDLLTQTSGFSLALLPPFLLGGGVAYAVDPAPLLALRRPLRERFAGGLTPQDGRPWKRPHLTVQNKVDKDTARRLHHHLSERYTPCTLRVRGLVFYRYDGGPWTELERIPFGR